MYQRIFVPVDSSTQSELALDEAIDQETLRQAIDEGYLTRTRNRLIALPEGRLRLDALLAALVR